MEGMARRAEKTAAVVVTYNRLELLKRNIEALLAQTAACDILLVDNASTDGTGEAMRALEQAGKIQYRNTGANLGGAGGFNYGMRWAVEAGYQYVWIMDDDCLPNPDALEKLLEADSLLGGPENYGFLSSAVLWTDGRECVMNRQKIAKDFYRHVELLKHGVIQIQQATFVSLLFPRESILRFGLPIKEFFIWGDDIEYTRRMAVRGNTPCYLAGQSQVIHATKNNTGSNIALDDADRIDRYFYAFRNEAYLYRQEGIRGRAYCVAKRCRDLLGIIRYGKKKALRLRTLLHGIRAGFFFRPEVEGIEQWNEVRRKP